MALLDATPWIGYAKGVTTTVGDTFIDTPAGAKGVIVDKFTTTNASTSLASSTSTAGLYTAASAGGTAIVTAATALLTPLTTSAKYVDGTIASSGTVITPAQQTTGTFAGRTGFFLNVGGTNNVPATFDGYVQGRILA